MEVVPSLETRYPVRRKCHNQLKDSKTAKRISCIWFHTDRAIGRHLDHRIADRPTATGTEEIT